MPWLPRNPSTLQPVEKAIAPSRTTIFSTSTEGIRLLQAVRVLSEVGAIDVP
jgi:hypothetical protein